MHLFSKKSCSANFSNLILTRYEILFFIIVLRPHCQPSSGVVNLWCAEVCVCVSQCALGHTEKCCVRFIICSSESRPPEEVKNRAYTSNEPVRGPPGLGCIYVSTHHRAQTCSKCPLSRLRLPSVPSPQFTSALREGPRSDPGRPPTPRLTAQLLRGRPGFRAQLLLPLGGRGRRLFLSSGEGGGRERLMRREVLNFDFLLL